ncbi:MAG: hypothetical protein JNM51_05635, partial [Bacteroidia bacterium]|nr:hypothetical protein [Bacteroidia bacterium]
MNDLFANKDEINRFIQTKVETLTRQRVQQEIANPQNELIEKQNELNKLQRDLSEQQNNLFKKEQDIEKQAFQINQKIKAEIDKHERDLELKQKELERKKIEVERELEEKFKQKEKTIELKQKELDLKTAEAERKIQEEIQRKERDLEEKKLLKDKKIPEFVNKAKDDVKKAQRDLTFQQSEIVRRQQEILRKQKELAEREARIKKNLPSQEEKFDQDNIFAKKRRSGDEESEGWMVTYSDVITLLLTMFVFLYSISKIDTKKMEEIQKAISIGLLKKSGESIVEKGSRKNPLFEAIKKRIQTVFEKSSLSHQAKISITENGVKIELANSALYDAGSADIKTDFKPVLEEITSILKNSNIPNYLVNV